MEAEWPALDLTLTWNGEHYAVPPPVFVPREALGPGLRRWEIHKAADWHVKLADGRDAIVWTTRDQSDRVNMSRVTVYRADGTLEHEQWSYDGRPNSAGRWRTYDADGRSPKLEVCAGHGYVNTVIFYTDGRRVREFIAERDGGVTYDRQFAPDGTATDVHTRPDRIDPGGTNPT
jgi:hypothetical protein